MDIEKWKIIRMDGLHKMLNLVEFDRNGDTINKPEIVDFLDKNINTTLYDVFEKFNIELEGSDTEE